MYPATPEGWRRISARRVGPFTTHVVFERPDGTRVRWGSRHHRKHRSRLSRPVDDAVWWAPWRASWWIGVLFAVGSACFLVGPLPGVVELLGVRSDALVFFVGSIFFTTAAALQLLEALSADRSVDVAETAPFRVLRLEPSRIDLWAGVIQLVGTVLFNVSTFDALLSDLSVQQTDRLVFRPDALGSVCFLVSSWLSYAEACGGGWCRPRRDIPRWIGTLNLVGSIAFGVSAVASFVLPTDGEPVNVAIANGFTSLGGACFLAGAVLLLPEGAASQAVGQEAEPASQVDGLGAR